MRLFRRQQAKSSGGAVIRLYGRAATADQITASTVQWNGDDDALPYLIPAYFDKILFNLTQMPAEQQALLDRFETLVIGARDDLANTDEATIDARIGLAPVVESPPAPSALAEIHVDVSVIHEQERAGAATHFVPPHAANETVAELGWWSLWDWSVTPFEGNKETLGLIFDRLAGQLAYYRARGMPGLGDIGKAPYAALGTDPSEIATLNGSGLGAELFAHSPHTYQRRANEILADRAGRPHLSETAKRLVGEITYPLMSFYADQPLGEIEMTPFLKGLARMQGETISGSYALAKSETWESLEDHRFVALMEEGLGETMEADPRRAIVRTIRGLIGDLPEYESVAAYLKTQPTYERLAAFAETQSIRPDPELADLLRSDEQRREKIEFAVSFGWKIGVALGVMDILGLVPAEA